MKGLLKNFVGLFLLVAFGLASLMLPQGRLALAKSDWSLATEYTSPSFKILDPVIDTGGTANSESSNFLQLGAQGQVGTGFSTSSSFILKSGFLYFGEEDDGGDGIEEPPPPPGGVVLPFPFSPLPPYYDLLTRIFAPKEPRPSCVDLNDDGMVGLADASIMFFNWFGQSDFLAGLVLKNTRPDCNEDNLVDVIDLSIMLFWWDET